MSSALLVGLTLTDRAVLVTGAGPAAAAQAAELRARGARVRVVGAHVCEDVRDLAATNAVVLHERDPEPADLADVWLVVAADGGPAERARVRAWADDARVWCLDVDTDTDPAVDAAAAVSARPVATVAASGVEIGVLADPARAASLRDEIGALLDEGALDVRRPAAATATSLGSVTLVGGGPGAPELITVAGRRALAEADVVVTDRLGPVSVLQRLRPGVEVIDVGKTPGHHPVPQHEINRLLVEHAQRGRRVVRLKGGDPFLLGRGGEEVLACREARVPVDVVPGITSALAVPALADIPVTQRQVVAALHVTSGHEPLAEAALASVRDRSATLLVLMGVSNLGHVVEQLLGADADPATPVAIVERGSTPEQRTTRAPLTGIVAAAALARVRAPAVIVVGDVAAADLLEPADPA